jgi:hypothetical protein
MEIIEIKPQSLNEKVQIGIHYQLPPILKQNGFYQEIFTYLKIV